MDDSTFARFAEQYEYDHPLPLHAKVLDTRIYNGRELPYAVDKINFRQDRPDVRRRSSCSGWRST